VRRHGPYRRGGGVGGGTHDRPVSILARPTLTPPLSGVRGQQNRDLKFAVLTTVKALIFVFTS
jgi:hypothetical protein